MGILQIVQLLSLALDAAESFKIDMGKFYSMRAQAKREGRTLSVEELQQLADESQAAIDAIGP